MNPDFEAIPLQQDAARQQLLLTVNHYPSFISYRMEANKIFLEHTEVNAALKGMGVGSALVEKVLQYAKAHQLKVVAHCPFVAAYIKKHPNWAGILAG